jgi:hypothetical protein
MQNSAVSVLGWHYSNLKLLLEEKSVIVELGDSQLWVQIDKYEEYEKMTISTDNIKLYQCQTIPIH